MTNTHEPTIKKHFLQHGMYYSGIGLYNDVIHGSYARWNEHTKTFWYVKQKWNKMVLDEIEHCDDKYGGFSPLTMVEQYVNIPLNYEDKNE